MIECTPIHVSTARSGIAVYLHIAHYQSVVILVCEESGIVVCVVGEVKA